MLRGVILFLALSSSAVSAPDPLALAAIAYQHPSLHKLNWIGRQIASAMSDSPFKLDEKTTFLYNNPSRALVIRATTCEAWAQAAAACSGADTEPKDTLVVHHDEADAVRHFILAAHLTCAQGRKVAEVFLAANEGHPTKWARTNEMDIHNNYQGIFWAENRRNCNPIGLNHRIARASAEALRSGSLVTLRKGRSVCADAGSPPLSLGRLPEFRVALRHTDARCGGKTITSP